MDISLPAELTAIIEHHMATGGYHSPEEVVIAALQQLDAYDDALEREIDAENERRWQNFQQTQRSVSHAAIGAWVDQLPMNTNDIRH